MFGFGDGRVTNAQHGAGTGRAPRVAANEAPGGPSDPIPGCGWLHAAPCTNTVDVGGRFSPPRSRNFGKPSAQTPSHAQLFPIAVSQVAEPLPAPRPGAGVPAACEKSCWMPVACSGTGASSLVCGGYRNEIVESDDRHLSDDDSDAEMWFAKRRPAADTSDRGVDLSQKPRDQCCASQRTCNGNVGDCMDNLLDVDQGEVVDMRSAARLSQQANYSSVRA